MELTNGLDKNIVGGKSDEMMIRIFEDIAQMVNTREPKIISKLPKLFNEAESNLKYLYLHELNMEQILRYKVQNLIKDAVSISPFQSTEF